MTTVLDRLRSSAGLSSPTQTTAPAKGGRKSVASRITEHQVVRLRADLGQWRNALSWAENIYYPDRTELLRLYREAVLDSHLSSVMETRKLNLLSQPFKIVAKAGGKEDEKLTRLFQTPWFYKFCLEAMEARFWGPRIVELLPPVDGEFAGLEVIQPEMTIPEFGLIRDAPGAVTGVHYREGADAPWIIQLGDSRDLGLLHKAIPHVIWKKNATSAWSEYCERFALPIRTVTMDLQDEDRQEVENMLRNMGRAAYAILPPGTEFEFHQPQTFNTDVFSGLIDYPNKELSKLILGQTMTTEDGSSKAQGEVHERVADKYTLADKTYVRNLVMWELWDKLLLHGYPVAGFEFKWDESENLPKEKLFTIVQGIMKDSGFRVTQKYLVETFGVELEDKPEPPAPVLAPGAPPTEDKQPPAPEKLPGRPAPTQPAQAMTSRIEAMYAHACARCGGTASDARASSPADTGKLTKLMNRLMEAMHGGDLFTGTIDQPLYAYLRTHLQDAVQLGFGVADPKLRSYLLANVQCFSGFKTAAVQRAMSEKLTDAKGNIRPFAEFRADCLDINQRYNVDYLRTEYNQAVASSQMAARWSTFDSDSLLRYDTVGDELVRPEHAKLDGITRAHGDAFWDDHYPPLAWNCRCTATEMDDEAQATPDHQLAGLPEASEGFRENVGKTGQIFGADHPYFQLSAAEARKLEQQL